MSKLTLRWQQLIPAIAVLGLISVVSIAVVQLLGGGDHMRRLVEGAGVWGPVVFVALKALTNIIAPLSGSPLVIGAGAMFGVWEGVVLVTIGDVIGETANFWIARLLGRPGIARLAGAG